MRPATRTVVVIPARGGSKGIPRKNLRPMRGRPLIAWVIEAARSARGVDAVVVSTDSDEIATVARRHGATALMRDPKLGADHVTLDPVVHEAVTRLEQGGQHFDLVLTIQPTSPLLRAATIERIIERLSADAGIDTILTAVDDTHLAWTRDERGFRPDYTARLNRQQLPPRFRETGGVLATRRACVSAGARIGPRVDLEVLNPIEGLDIDSSDDWMIAEAALNRRRVAFLVIGNRRQGLGHISRVMTLMQCMTGHDVRAFCAPDQDLAIARLRETFFPHEVVERSERLEALRRFGADIVVHDELDTDAATLEAERAAGMRVVCFEDTAAGLTHADRVFNALYPAEQSDAARGHYYGPEAYVIRDEFLNATRRPAHDDVARVLITFGGTDPANLTHKVIAAIAPVCKAELVVVAGKGLLGFGALEQRCEALVQAGARIELHRDVALMSEIMAGVDVAFSSAGRTLYELAFMGVPAIVLAQNELELKHSFADPRYGFLPLGLGKDASHAAIVAAFEALTSSAYLRRTLRERMAASDLTSGRERVVRMILELT